jgi:hypothetical protein
MSCTSSLCWIFLLILMSSFVPVTGKVSEAIKKRHFNNFFFLESCSSAFGFGRKTRHQKLIVTDMPTTTLESLSSTYETPTTEMETVTPTTDNILLINMTETPENSSTDKPSLLDQYDSKPLKYLDDNFSITLAEVFI